MCLTRLLSPTLPSPPPFPSPPFPALSTAVLQLIILPGLLIMSACLGKYIAYSDILRKLAPRRFRAISTKLRREMEKRGLNVTALTKGEKYALEMEAKEQLKQRRKDEKARSKMHKRMKKERGWKFQRSVGRSRHTPMPAATTPLEGMHQAYSVSLRNLATLPGQDGAVVDREAFSHNPTLFGPPPSVGPLRRSVSDDSLLQLEIEDGYLETTEMGVAQLAWQHSRDSLNISDELDVELIPDDLLVIRGQGYREDRGPSAPYATISSMDSLLMAGDNKGAKRHDPDAESVTLSLNLKGDEDARSVTNSLLGNKAMAKAKKEQEELDMMVRNEFSPEIEKYVLAMRFWKRCGYFFGKMMGCRCASCDIASMLIYAQALLKDCGSGLLLTNVFRIAPSQQASSSFSWV